MRTSRSTCFRVRGGASGPHAAARARGSVLARPLVVVVVSTGTPRDRRRYLHGTLERPRCGHGAVARAGQKPDAAQTRVGIGGLQMMLCLPRERSHVPGEGARVRVGEEIRGPRKRVGRAVSHTDGCGLTLRPCSRKITRILGRYRTYLGRNPWSSSEISISVKYDRHLILTSLKSESNSDQIKQ